jgi:hypothetical protein
MELEERIEGKNRKTKEQMEKERKQREAERAKMEKEEAARAEKEEIIAESNDKSSQKPDIVKKDMGGSRKQESGFLKKVFQRKSV